MLRWGRHCAVLCRLPPAAANWQRLDPPRPTRPLPTQAESFEGHPPAHLPTGSAVSAAARPMSPTDDGTGAAGAGGCGSLAGRRLPLLLLVRSAPDRALPPRCIPPASAGSYGQPPAVFVGADDTHKAHRP